MASTVKKSPEETVKKVSAKKVGKAAEVKKMSDQDMVAEYMNRLQHPMKAEIEAVRAIIKSTHPEISERVKWNAPSYYYKEDMVTFNPRATNHVHLVFHHRAIADIPSPLLHGNYVDRRMMYFKDIHEIRSAKKELARILLELISKIDEGGYKKQAAKAIAGKNKANTNTKT